MVSIILPVLNEAKNLPNCLRSLKAQTFTDYEIIVANSPLTTDNSAAIAASFGAHVVLGGKVGEGRNLGAAAAKGDLLLFLDADIILPDPYFLGATVAEFKRRHLGVATCLIQPLSDRLDDKFFHEIFNFYITMVQDFAPHAPGFCIFVQRSLHEAVGGFDEEIKLAEDYDYVMRVSRIGKYGILKCYKIPVSVRRFKRDGRLNVAMKMLLAEIYLHTKGNIKTDVFKYTFGHDEDADKTAAQEIKEGLQVLAKLARARARKITAMLKRPMRLAAKPRVKRGAKKRKTTP